MSHGGHLELGGACGSDLEDARSNGDCVVGRRCVSIPTQLGVPFHFRRRTASSNTTQRNAAATRRRSSGERELYSGMGGQWHGIARTRGVQMKPRHSFHCGTRAQAKAERMSYAIADTCSCRTTSRGVGGGYGESVSRATSRALEAVSARAIGQEWARVVCVKSSSLAHGRGGEQSRQQL